jgi:hypothetical protein
MVETFAVVKHKSLAYWYRVAHIRAATGCNRF